MKLYKYRGIFIHEPNDFEKYLSDLAIFKTGPDDYLEIAKLYLVDGYDYPRIVQKLVEPDPTKSDDKVDRISSALNRIIALVKLELDHYKKNYESSIPGRNRKCVDKIKLFIASIESAMPTISVSSIRYLDAYSLDSPAGTGTRSLLSEIYNRSVVTLIMKKLQQENVELIEVNIQLDHILTKIRKFPLNYLEAFKGQVGVAHGLLLTFAYEFIYELLGEYPILGASYEINGRVRYPDGYVGSQRLSIECGQTSINKIKDMLKWNGSAAVLFIPFQGVFKEIESCVKDDFIDGKNLSRIFDHARLPDNVMAYFVLNTCVADESAEAL